MRIVDKRRDYYDCLQAQGQDLSLIYVRTEKTIDLSKHGSPFHDFRCDYISNLHLQTHNIGFCGKVYPVIEIGSYTVGNKTFCYSVDDFDTYMEKNCKDDEIDGYKGNRNDHGRRFNWPFSCRRYSIVRFFEEAKKVQSSFQKWFDAESSPIFVATRVNINLSVIVYNSLLRPYNFMRMFDPPRAFQEIQMYMSNMAMPDRPIPQLSNDDLAHSKGHGDKYSFRTAPGTKPGRKKK